MLADGEDSVCLMINTGGVLAVRQGSREAVARLGEAILLVYREPAVIDLSDATYLAVRFPSKAIEHFFDDIGAAAAKHVSSATDAMKLLRGYLASIPARMTDARLGHLSAAHVYDLIALAICSTPDPMQRSPRRSLSAARLHAMKADIIRDSTLALSDLAARHSISPRYVQALFEREGLTFSNFVAQCRLDKARAMLISPRYDQFSVTSLALESGFGDLSYFHRCFKQRYQVTPMQMRAQRSRIGEE
jgi:AraC-like DNA-binding protein